MLEKIELITKSVYQTEVKSSVNNQLQNNRPTRDRIEVRKLPGTRGSTPEHSRDIVLGLIGKIRGIPFLKN